MIKKIIKGIVTILVILILFISCVILIDSIKNKDEVPSFFGWKPFIVLSGSMETSIYTGDLVVVKETDAISLKVDDIIAFRNEADTVTTHRIVDVINQNGNVCFRTKGDNNNTEDANLVKVEEVEGIYVFKISGLGNILMILKEPKSLAVILLVILVIGLIWINILDKIEKKNLKIEDEKYRKEFEEFKRQQKNKEEK